jgi:hypothetical protein
VLTMTCSTTCRRLNTPGRTGPGSIAPAVDVLDTRYWQLTREPCIHCVVLLTGEVGGGTRSNPMCAAGWQVHWKGIDDVRLSGHCLCKCKHGLSAYIAVEMCPYLSLWGQGCSFGVLAWRYGAQQRHGRASQPPVVKH